MYNGAFMLLKIKLTKDWKLIGGMRATKFAISNDIIETNLVTSDGWRVLLEGGLKQVNISLSGAFTDSKAEREICNLALSGKLAKYKLEFANNENLEGSFKIVNYDRVGDVDKEELYSMNIASSGLIEFCSN
jgi:predicted secreted protein